MEANLKKPRFLYAGFTVFPTPFIYLFIYLFMYVFIYLFICLFVCLFIYLFIYLFISPLKDYNVVKENKLNMS